jgi:transcription elongation GreA/GreB family factor
VTPRELAEAIFCMVERDGGLIKSRLEELLQNELNRGDAPSRHEQTRVCLGSEITVLDEQGNESVFVLTETLALPGLGLLSANSLFGRTFLGKKVGDEVIFKVPTGERRMKIIAVT